MKIFLIFASLLMIQCSLEEDSVQLKTNQDKSESSERPETSDEWGDSSNSTDVDEILKEVSANEEDSSDEEKSPVEQTVEQTTPPAKNPTHTETPSQNLASPPAVEQTQTTADVQDKKDDDDDFLKDVLSDDEEEEVKSQESPAANTSPVVNASLPDLESYNFSSLRAKLDQDRKAIEGLNKISTHTYSLEESLAYYRAYVRFFTIYGRGLLYSKKFNYQKQENLGRALYQCKEGLNTYQTALYYQEAKKMTSTNKAVDPQSLVSDIKHKIENYERYYDGKKVVLSGFLDDYQKNKMGLSPVFSSYSRLIPYFKQTEDRKAAIFFKDVMNRVIDGDENVTLAFYLSFYLGMIDAIEEVYKQVHLAYQDNPSLMRNRFNSFISCLKDLRVNVMRFNREPILMKQYASLFAEYHLSDFASLQKRKAQLSYRLHQIKSTSFFNRDFPVRPEKYLVEKSFLKVHYPQYVHLLEKKSSTVNTVKSFFNKVKSYFTKKED